MAKRKSKSNIKLFPDSLSKAGLLLVITGVFFLGIRYLELPYINKIVVLSYIPLWSRNLIWGIILLGFILQYLDAE